jgi:hypothetical protein
MKNICQFYNRLSRKSWHRETYPGPSKIPYLSVLAFESWARASATRGCGEDNFSETICGRPAIKLEMSSDASSLIFSSSCWYVDFGNSYFRKV